MSDGRGENPYPLREEMEVAYLASKGDQESVGTPWQCNTCYIAQILTHAYDGLLFDVTRDYYECVSGPDSPQWTMPGWATDRLDCFDHIPAEHLTFDGKVEKEVWLREWQAYQQKRGWL